MGSPAAFCCAAAPVTMSIGKTGLLLRDGFFLRNSVDETLLRDVKHLVCEVSKRDAVKVFALSAVSGCDRHQDRDDVTEMKLLEHRSCEPRDVSCELDLRISTT